MPINDEEDRSIQMNGTERIYTFGGEYADSNSSYAEYGIDFDNGVAVHGLTPAQAIQLAQTLTDHLILNGHSFEIRCTGEQDQHTRLVLTGGSKSD